MQRLQPVFAAIWRGIVRTWQRGRWGKIAVVVGAFVLSCCGLALIGAALPQPRTATQPTAAATRAPIVVAEPTSAPESTSEPRATSAPTAVPTAVPSATPAPPTAEPTAIPATATPAPPTAIPATPTPEPTQAPEARYIAIAKAGLKTPSLRSTFGLPAGEWSAQAFDNGDGPLAIINFPIGPGATPEQTVRFAKLQCAQIVKALFDAVPELVQVTAFGTLPDGAGQAELGAVSIVVSRAAYSRWSGVADDLGEWRIAPRYK